MTRWTSLLAHEWRVLGRERTVWALTLLLLVLVAAGVRNGAAWVGQQRATLAAIAAHDEALFARLETQVRELEARGEPPRNLPIAGMAWYLLQADREPPPAPHLDPRRPEAAGSEWGAARYAVLPPDSLAAVSIGQSDLRPWYARITIRTRPALLNNDEIENPLTLLNGRFDLAFVLVFCWPLIALPLACDLLSHERDEGTLPLALSQPITLQRLVLAKIAVRAGWLVTVTLVAAGASLWLTGSMAGADVAVKLAVLTLLVVAVAVLWFGAALLVNTAGWRSSMNAVVLAAIWLGWTLVLPALLDLLVTAAAPIPSRVAFVSAMRAATNAASGDVARLVAHYYEEHPALSPPDATPQRNAVRAVALQQEAERRVQPVVDRFEASLARQAQWAARVRYLSPALLLQEAMNELAGTSTRRYRRFADQLETHHRAWRAFFYPRIYQQKTIAAADYRRMPAFAYAPERAATVLARALTSVGLVLTGGAALGLLGIRRLSRYPVTSGAASRSRD